MLVSNRDLTRLAILPAIGALFALIGPFGTFQDLSLLGRLAYWIPSCALIGTLTLVANRVVVSIPPTAAWPMAAQCLIGALFAGLPATFIVVAMEALFRIAPRAAPLPLLQLYGFVTVTTAAISVPFYLHARRSAGAPAPTPAAAQTPTPSSFLRRIPARLGSKLLYLATEDHYVRAVTDRGSDLILYRLSDAVSELGSEAGLQVHRSYWVARDAVASTAREGHKLVLVLVNGDRIPVSRSYRATLASAGWLQE